MVGNRSGSYFGLPRFLHSHMMRPASARSIGAIGAFVLASILAAACGGDGGGTAPADVATVNISGAPTAPLLVGNTVQLIATPLNSSGAVVSNQGVRWKSSDVAVATISGGGLLTAVGPGHTTVTATVGSGTGTAEIDVAAGGEIGTNGGTLTMLGGAVTIVVPPAAVAQPVTVLVGRATGAPENARLVGGTSYVVGPDGLAFDRPSTLTIRYDPAQLPNGTVEASLQLYMVSGDRWTLVGASTVSTASHTVSGEFTRSGTYAIVSTPVNRITIGGQLVGGALFTGQSTLLTATLYDEANTVLSGRPVTWTTSDAAKAAVGTDGRVTAVAQGSVTITAASDGKQATTTLAILPRPTADWSQATEWTTYQGNAAHTGYVAVTMDPGVFQELWSATAANSALNPVTAADGKVFVTQNSYFGTQIGRALDARTGTELWSRDFGGIHSVDPPAYANGVVYLQTGGHEDSFLWGIDASTGTVKFRTAYGNQWSRWYAPVIIGSTVYVAGGYYGGMYAFSATDGSQQWFAGLNQYDQFVPAVRDGLVYAYTGDYAPKLTVADATTGQVSYEIADPEFSWNGWSMNEAPVLGSASNLLATNGGRLLSFDLQGRRIGYALKSNFVGQVTLADGVIYAVNNGQVEARKESDGSLLWLWIPPEGTATGPVIATRNLLLVGTGANTYAIDIASQKQVWGIRRGARSRSVHRGFCSSRKVRGSWRRSRCGEGEANA